VQRAWSVVGPARDNPEAASIAYVDAQIGVWFDTCQRAASNAPLKGRKTAQTTTGIDKYPLSTLILCRLFGGLRKKRTKMNKKRTTAISANIWPLHRPTLR
jgi:hypothetical protein